jgi:superfamily II DNA or RNA helicase
MDKLEKYMNQIPDYMYMPAYKGEVKPEVFLNKFRVGSDTVYWVFSGLLKTVIDWCKKNSIEIDFPEDDSKYLKYTGYVPKFDEFCKVVSGWGLNLDPRDYQLKAAWLILSYRQSLSQLATRAGKTLIAYIVFRWMVEKCGAHNILMIVPNISLVKQGVEDMKNFKEFFVTETVWAGSELCSTSNLTIGTFQSLVKRIDKKSNKYDPDFLSKFDVVCCDEAHTAKCASIKSLLMQPFMKDLKLRFGFTGTLPKEDTIEWFTCSSLLGPKIQDIRSRELMDRGFISDIEVTQIVVEHPETDDLLDTYIHCGEYLCSEYVLDSKKEKVLLPKDKREFTMIHEKKLPVSTQKIRKEMFSKFFDLSQYPRETEEDYKKFTDDLKKAKKEYIEYLYDICKSVGSNSLMLEQMLVHRDTKRLKAIETLLRHFSKNCIVFAHHTEYLKYLYNYFKDLFPSRPVYIITGETSVKKRETIKKSLETDKGAILFASYSCIGTGLTLKNLDYGVFAQSFRSEIINKQSLGRGLMLAQDKDKYRLYDIVDKFPTKKLYYQGRSKNKLFKDEKFDTYTVDSDNLDKYLTRQLSQVEQQTIKF